MLKKKAGFSLLELMIVIAIMGFLAVIAVPSFTRYLAKAKRAEAFINLGSLYVAEKSYYAEHGNYTAELGNGGLGWSPEGYSKGGKDEKFFYTYGIGQGSEGKNFFTGKLETPSSSLKDSYADNKGFKIIAAGDIDGDGDADILSIDQNNNIIIVHDDLA